MNLDFVGGVFIITIIILIIITSYYIRIWIKENVLTKNKRKRENGNGC